MACKYAPTKVENETVHLADRWLDFNVANGDQATVTGFETECNEQKVAKSTDVIKNGQS